MKGGIKGKEGGVYKYYWNLCSYEDVPSESATRPFMLCTSKALLLRGIRYERGY